MQVFEFAGFFKNHIPPLITPTWNKSNFVEEFLISYSHVIVHHFLIKKMKIWRNKLNY